MPRKLLFAFLIPLASFPDALVAQGRDGMCALSLDTPSGTEAAYRERQGGRCEGIYVRPAAASTRLILRGFHLGSPRYDLGEDEWLSVEVVGLSPYPYRTSLER